MAAARLSQLSAAEKASLLAALERVLAADHLDPTRHSALRIFLLEYAINRLRDPDTPLELDTLTAMLEAVLIASRSSKRARFH